MFCKYSGRFAASQDKCVMFFSLYLIPEMIRTIQVNISILILDPVFPISRWHAIFQCLDWSDKNGFFSGAAATFLYDRKNRTVCTPDAVGDHPAGFGIEWT